MKKVIITLLVCSAILISAAVIICIRFKNFDNEDNSINEDMSWSEIPTDPESWFDEPKSVMRTISENDFSYDVNTDGTVTITKYNGSETSGTIPSLIKGKKVTKIGERAFEALTEVKSLIIPDGVTSIEEYAFFGCTGLESIWLPDGLTSLGRCVFGHCKKLEDIRIPDSIAEISYCSGIEDTKWFLNQQNGMIYIGKIAYKFKGVIPKDYEMKIRPGTKIIASQAFMDYENIYKKGFMRDYAEYHIKSGNLKSIIIPDGLTIIGDEAFRHCQGLKTVVIPDSVTSIGELTFNHCESLETITIPDSVTSMGEDVFESCYNLKNVTLSNNLTELESGFFNGCRSLESIRIPDKVTSIGVGAFSGCINLKSITIPKSVTEFKGNSLGTEDWGYGSNTDFIIYGEKGSEAEKYAKEIGITFEVIE